VITSTIYASIAPSKVILVSFVHSRRCLSPNSSMTIPELPTSWCSILQHVQIYPFVDHGSFLLWAAINWSCCTLCTAAVHYTVDWQPFTMTLIYLHPAACCFRLLLLSVLWTIFECASWVIVRVAALAASQWTNKYLHSCCVPITDVLDAAPAIRRDFDPRSPGWSGWVSMICWWQIGENDDDENMWEVLRTI
jgi:hypothetical protein